MISTIDLWRKTASEDEILKKDLNNKDSKLENSFKSKMTFGTAGIRGIMGAGTSKMNEFTVAAAADAYAKFLIKEKKTKKGIVIGHDNRHNSKLYSLITARVFKANGLKAYLYKNNELQPTPVVSYTIRRMKLDGGVIITASHNPKEYNGFKVYNSDGQQLMPSATSAISKIMEDINPLEVKKDKWDELYVDQELIKNYTIEALKLQMNIIDEPVKVVFSAQHGTSAKLGPELLESMKSISVEVVKKQQVPDPDFKHTKTPNPEDGKSYQKAFLKAKKVKADLIVTTDPDADRIGIAVKYKRRYKYINGNESAALYLDYKLATMKKNKTLPKDGYIVTTHVSGDLATKIAAKYKVKVIRVHVGFKNIAEIIKKEKGTFMLGYEESYGMTIDADMTRDKDALQATVAFTDMVRFYKSQGTNLYSVLEKLWKEFGVHRSTQISKKLDSEMTNRLIKKIAKSKKVEIEGKRISKIEDFRKEGQNFVKAIMEDGTWFAVRPSGTEPKVKVYIETHGKPGQELIDVVKYEKAIVNWVTDNTEVFEDKHWSWKGFFKYVTFALIIVGMMAIVFKLIYKDSNGNSDPQSVFKLAREVMGNNFMRAIWIGIFISTFATRIIGAWILKRMFDIQGVKVKVRHLFIGSLMGTIISFVTPFTVGGDAIGYWYLRRKGYERGILASAFISNTILFEAKFALQSVILIPIGIPIYKEILGAGTPEATGVLIWFIVGTVWSLFATTMILSLTLGRRFQEWIVINSVRFLEWTRFVNLTDPTSKIAVIQYDFHEMRSGARRIWSNWLFLIEVMFYATLPLFLNLVGITLMLTNWTVSEVNGINIYLANIVLNDLTGTANSLSITPGGTGTSEFLDVAAARLQYGIVTPNGGNYTSVDGAKHVASGINLFVKLFFSWPGLLISALSIPTIITLENYRSKMKIRNNNLELRGQTTERLKPIKLYLSLSWIVFIGLFITYIFLI